MTTKRVLALLGVLALFAAPARAQEPSAEEAAMMQAWMAYMTPGAAHQSLAKHAGEWNHTVSWWMAPGAPAQESTATSTSEMILGGRYLAEHFSGNMMGMPFEGHGLTGYDNARKKYFSAWIDNMGTGIMISEGTHDAAARTWTYASESPDLMTGKYVPARMVERDVDADTFVMEMYGPDPKSGKMFKSMEINYTRAK